MTVPLYEMRSQIENEIKGEGNIYIYYTSITCFIPAASHADASDLWFVIKS